MYLSQPTRLVRFYLLALMLSLLLLFTACKSQAERLQEQLDLGQRYLAELNYTEAILAFTEAIEIDPENIPAYMGRATAYRGTEQYEEAKGDYTTVIGKAAEQPYTQAEAYVGRAEVNEITTDNEAALEDYQSAAVALETVEIEKITDVTEQMLEAMKIKVYNACARLSAFFGQHEAAVAAYTKALKSLERLPEDTDVMDVAGEKRTSYSGRVESNLKLEAYDAVLPDYDALIELGEDKSEDRDTLLAALSLAKSEAEDLGQTNYWLTEVEHQEYAQETCLSVITSTMEQIAALAEKKGEDAYDDIREMLTGEEAEGAMRELLARGYQLRWYDKTNEKMLAIYVGETAWPDVSEEKTDRITAEQIEEPIETPTEEELAAVSLSPMYVYYGEHKDRSREGEGLWYILDPGSRDYETHSYQWVDDAPVEGVAQKPAPQPAAPAVDYVRVTNIEFDRNSYLNKELTEYLITVEYNCPPNETFELRVGHYYKPYAYSWGSDSMTTISGSGVFQCRKAIYMDVLESKLEGTNFGFTAVLVNIKDISISDDGTRRSKPTDQDDLYIDAVGNLTRNKTGS